MVASKLEEPPSCQFAQYELVIISAGAMLWQFKFSFMIFFNPFTFMCAQIENEKRQSLISLFIITN